MLFYGVFAVCSVIVLPAVQSDVNHFHPEWESIFYIQSVLDSSPVGSVVLTLVATDGDRGKNGLVTYHFTPQQTDTSLGLFTLDQSSGELRVAKSLHDYAGRTFTLEVEARDSGTPFRSMTTEVIIYVLKTRNSSYVPSGAAPRAPMEARWEQKNGFFQLVLSYLSKKLNDIFIALK